MFFFVFVSGAKAQTRDLETTVAEFAAAFLTADTARLGRMLCTKYVHTNMDGSVHTKESWLAWVGSRRREIESGRLVIESYDNSDVQIVLHGSMAIVTGINTTAVSQMGRRETRRLRFTQVWITAGSRWKRAAFHDVTLTQR
jgi:ketosteroid isomerase-like protein